MTSTKCGYKSPKQGERRAATSPCELPAGHDGYHEDDGGLPFGPWQES